MRLDQALVERGLAASRSRAQELIREGFVSVEGAVANKASLKVGADVPLSVDQAAPTFVSRAALKLDHALQAFDVDPSGRVALDVGSSTGGFTDVLLRAGAAKVFAVDVGTDQLHPSLRQDSRVVSLEGTHAKALSKALIPDAPSIIVCDVSFISIMKALPAALALAHAGADLVTLVKPQFELGVDAIGKNGRVLTPPDEQRAFIDDVIVPFFAQQGWASRAVTDSPILGGEGTREFLWYAQKTAA
ncbi:MAG: TlyA family RNA methyltransferase [Parvularculaceae bacterium]|nr:TlyA family RNA methyltransferase [Parvularculaceae bacterium]